MKIQFFILLVSLVATAAPTSFKEVLKLGSENSKQIEEKRFLMEKAEIDLQKAKGLWKPSLNLKALSAPVYETTGNGTRYNNDYSNWGIFAGAELSIIQPLYAWGLNKNLEESAQNGLKVANLEFIQEQNKIIIQLINAYLNHQFTKKLLLLIDENKDKLETAEKNLSKNENSKEYLEFRIKKNLIEEKILELNSAREFTLKTLKFFTAKADLEISEDIEEFNYKSEDFAFYEKLALEKSLDLRKLDLGIRAREELLVAEKKKKYPLFFAGAKGDLKYSNVKEKQNNPWLNDPYNDASAGIYLGAKMDLDINQVSTNEKTALFELKKLKIKKEYAEKGLSTLLYKSYLEFLQNKKIIALHRDSMKTYKRLLVKEKLRYDLKKDNGKEILQTLFEHLLSIKNYYTAIINTNLKYIEVMDACGEDLTNVSIYE